MRAELPRVAADPDADEGEAAVGEEVEQGVRDVVGAEDLEDEAAAADAELQQRDGARRDAAGRGGPPLDVQAHDEAVEAAAVDAVDLAQPLVDDVAGARQGGVDALLVERHDVVAVAEVLDDSGRHSRSSSNFFGGRGSPDERRFVCLGGGWMDGPDYVLAEATAHVMLDATVIGQCLSMATATYFSKSKRRVG
jgi:hypothetical protein